MDLCFKRGINMIEMICPISRKTFKLLRKKNTYVAYYTDVVKEGDKYMLIVGLKIERKDYIVLSKSGWTLIYFKVDRMELRMLKDGHEIIKIVNGIKVILKYG